MQADREWASEGEQKSMKESMRDGAGTSTTNVSVSQVRTEWVFNTKPGGTAGE